MTLNKFLQHIGRNIKSARINAGLRQVDIEEKIGLNYRHYQNIEAGRTNISIATLYRLAKLFKIEAEEIVSSKPIKVTKNQ